MLQDLKAKYVRGKEFVEIEWFSVQPPPGAASEIKVRLGRVHPLGTASSFEPTRDWA